MELELLNILKLVCKQNILTNDDGKYVKLFKWKC